MTAKRKRTVPVWSDVKARLIAFDHAGLLGLIHDLYAASKDNQTFLHARFGLGSRNVSSTVRHRLEIV